MLLDLCLFELDVLARHWIILVEYDLFGRCAWVLFGYVKEAGAGCREQLDLLGDGFGHGKFVLLARCAVVDFAAQ